MSTDEDFVQVERIVAEMDPLNGAMIRRPFGERYYGAYVISIQQSLSTSERWYIVQYQDGTTEVLQESVVQQGVEDLANPSAARGWYGKNEFFLPRIPEATPMTATLKEFALPRIPEATAMTAKLKKFALPRTPETTPEDGDM